MSVLTMKLEYIKRDIGDYELRSPTCKHFSLFKIMNDTHFYLKTYPLTSALSRTQIKYKLIQKCKYIYININTNLICIVILDIGKHLGQRKNTSLSKVKSISSFITSFFF